MKIVKVKLADCVKVLINWVTTRQSLWCRPDWCVANRNCGWPFWHIVPRMTVVEGCERVYLRGCVDTDCAFEIDCLVHHQKLEKWVLVFWALWTVDAWHPIEKTISWFRAWSQRHVWCWYVVWNCLSSVLDFVTCVCQTRGTTCVDRKHDTWSLLGRSCGDLEGRLWRWKWIRRYFVGFGWQVLKCFIFKKWKANFV